VPDISWWSEWNKARKLSQPLSVELKRALIVGHKDVYVVLFKQFIKLSGGEVPAGTRKIFLTRRDGQFRIIGEEYQGTPKKRKIVAKGETPFIAAYRNLKIREEYEDDEQEIAEMIDNWLKAWSSKDIDQYGSYYASNFRSQGMDLKSWLTYKKQLNRKYDYIRVSKKKLRVKKGSEKRIVSFVQTYESNAFRALGMKQLILKRENGQWKIYRETWRKM